MVPRLALRAWYVVVFLAYFLWEMFIANLRVGYDVLTVTHYMRPGILALPLEARTDAEITILANLISLTPGTLSLDVSSDRTVLFVHAMYLGEIEEFKRFERRFLRAMR